MKVENETLLMTVTGEVDHWKVPQYLPSMGQNGGYDFFLSYPREMGIYVAQLSEASSTEFWEKLI